MPVFRGFRALRKHRSLNRRCGKLARFSPRRRRPNCAFLRVFSANHQKGGSKNVFFEGSKKGVKPSSPSGSFPAAARDPPGVSPDNSRSARLSRRRCAIPQLGGMCPARPPAPRRSRRVRFLRPSGSPQSGRNRTRPGSTWLFRNPMRRNWEDSSASTTCKFSSRFIPTPVLRC